MWRGVKVKIKNWHIFLLVIAVILIVKYGGFLGALSGICESQEPTSAEGIMAIAGTWQVGGLNGTVSGNDVVWSTSYLRVNDVSLVNSSMVCSDFETSLIASVVSQENASSRTFLEGTRRVFEFNKFKVGDTVFDSLYVWCGPTPNLVLQSNDALVEEKYFVNTFTCKECSAGIVENCSNNASRVWRTCSVEGSWVVENSCETTTTNSQSSSGVTNIIPVECGPEEQWVDTEHKCITQTNETEQKEQVTVEEKNWFSNNKTFIIIIGVMIIGLGFLVWKKFK